LRKLPVLDPRSRLFTGILAQDRDDYPITAGVSDSSFDPGARPPATSSTPAAAPTEPWRSPAIIRLPAVVRDCKKPKRGAATCA
jgi:hypothetical protein